MTTNEIIEHRGTSKSRITISSSGELKIIITDSDKEHEAEIVDYARRLNSKVGKMTKPIKIRVFIKNGKVRREKACIENNTLFSYNGEALRNVMECK